MTDHPITPPPDLVREWQIKIEYCSKRADREAVVAKIFQLGADMELDACCEWLETGPYGFSIEATAPSMTKRLRAARRPKPPTLKEQALAELELLRGDANAYGLGFDAPAIRRALEQLND